MANLLTEKSIGERVYFRRMKDYFEPENRKDEFEPAIVLDVFVDNSCLLRSPGVRGLLKPHWKAKWTEVFSGRDIVLRASNYTDTSKLENASIAPGSFEVYRWYEAGNHVLWDMLVNGIWGRQSQD